MGELGKGVNSVVSGLGDGVGSTVKGLGDGVGSTVKGVGKGAGQILGGIGGGFHKMGKGESEDEAEDKTQRGVKRRGIIAFYTNDERSDATRNNSILY